MSGNETIIQGAAGGIIIKPTWGTLDGASGEQGGINIDKIITDITALLEDEFYDKNAIDYALAGKENVLTWDDVPVSGSNNPVKSGGIYTALSGKQNTLTFDSSPTSGSTNPVTSGGIYTALSEKSDSNHNHDADYVNVTGDTMSGNLTISRSSESTVALKNTSVTTGTAPSSNKSVGSLVFRDSLDNILSYISNIYTTEKRSITRILVRQIIDGSNVDNKIDLNVNADGTKSVYVTDPEAWRSAIGAVNIAGDTMTGKLILSSEGLETSNANGFTMNTSGNFIHKRNNTGDYWNIMDNASNPKFSVFWETGEVRTYNKIVYNPSNGVSYIQGAGGQAAGIYAKKPAINAAHYIPAVTLQTYGGGGWAIGNYNNENLVFSYGTKANIDSNTNTTKNISIDTNGNYSGNAVNVTGTVDIDHGGTGQTTLPKARQALFPTNLSSTAGYVIAITANWADGGWISLPFPINQGGTGQTGTTTANATLNTDKCSQGVIVCRKWGKVVQVYSTTAVRLINALSSGTAVIATIPDGYRPANNLVIPIGGTGNLIFGWLETNGKLSLFKPDSGNFPAATNIYLSGTYLLA